AATLIGAHQIVAEFDGVVLLLILAGFAHGQHRLFDVLSGGARDHQVGRRDIDLGGEVNVLEAHLAGAAATTRRKRAALGRSPREAFDFDFVRVLFVSGFTLDAVNLQQIVESHALSSLRSPAPFSHCLTARWSWSPPT